MKKTKWLMLLGVAVLFGAIACGGEAQDDGLDISSSQNALTVWSPEKCPPIPPEYPQVPGFPYFDTDVAMGYFLTPSANVAHLLPSSKLQVMEILPGQTMVAIAFFQNNQPAPGVSPYNEMGIGIPVFDLVALLQGREAVHIIQLPIDDAWARDIGIDVWGLPKFLAQFKVSDNYFYKVVEAWADGKRILTLRVRKNGAVSTTDKPKLTFYSDKDNVLMKFTWDLAGQGKQGLLGTSVSFGDHPVGQQLAAMGVSNLAMKHFYGEHLAGMLTTPLTCTEK